MKINDILEILREGESQKTEFKTTFNKEVIESLVAFANTYGGLVLIGVDDKGTVKGFDYNNESIQQWLNEIKQTTNPQIVPEIDTFSIEDKKVICFSIQEFPIKPIAYKERYLVRRFNSNDKLSADEIVDLRLQSLNFSYDSYEVNTSYKDLDTNTLDIFRKRLEQSGRYSISGSLFQDFEKLGLIKNGKLTRACELLFGLHHTSIHIGRFKTPIDIIDDIEIRSPLIMAVEEAINFIKRNISLQFEISNTELKRTETWQYPIPVIRELLLNAIVHRDYSNPTDVIIKIFDDSIEIVNPGKLIGGLTIESLKSGNYLARHRNKLLAEAFYLIGDIEKYGTGFRRIYNRLNAFPDIQFELENLSDLFKVSISTSLRNNVIENVTNVTNDVTNVIENVTNDTFGKRETEILEMLKMNNKISTVELANNFHVSKRTILRYLSILKTKKKIEWYGNLKSGYWVIKNQ